MTRKRALFPCYGMQWGSAVYLYPIESSLVEIYLTPPRPEQLIYAITLLQEKIQKERGTLRRALNLS